MLWAISMPANQCCCQILVGCRRVRLILEESSQGDRRTNLVKLVKQIIKCSYMGWYLCMHLAVSALVGDIHCSEHTLRPQLLAEREGSIKERVVKAKTLFLLSNFTRGLAFDFESIPCQIFEVAESRTLARQPLLIPLALGIRTGVRSNWGQVQQNLRLVFAPFLIQISAFTLVVPGMLQPVSAPLGRGCRAVPECCLQGLSQGHAVGAVVNVLETT